MLLPQIETERLRLRAYRSEDLETVYRLCSDPDITRFFHAEHSVNRADVLASLPRRLMRWKTRGFGQFGAFDKTDDSLIGFCGLQHLDKTPDVEIYYGFFKKFWGKGLATEAARAVARFGFENAKLERIVAVTHRENAASQRVLKKIGATCEGEDREFYGVKADFFVLKRDEFSIDSSAYKLEFEQRDEPHSDV